MEVMNVVSTAFACCLMALFAIAVERHSPVWSDE